MTSRENLKKLSKSTLQKMCQDTGFDVKGKKKGDLVDLLFMSTLPPDQITPVLEQSSNLTGLMPQIHPESPLLPPFDKCNYSSIPYTELPTPSFVGIYHFMISRARESCQDRGVNNFKGMDRAVSHFESGDVQDIQVAVIDTSIIYIKAQCLASMKKDRYTVYLCLTNEDHDLKIHYAYCQCPIGLAQSCSHIGAVLLALNGKDRLKSDQDTACTSQLCKWVVPRSSNPIPQPVTQMDFGKPKAEGPTKVSSSTFDPRHPDDRGHDSGYLFRQLKELKKCFPDTGIAHLWDIEDEVPEAVSEVIIDEDEGPSKEIERYIYSKGRVVPLTISTNLVKEIEMHTRGQRLSPLWHDLHKGRITSSSFGKVLRAGHSPNSLVKNIIEGSNLQNNRSECCFRHRDHDILIDDLRKQYGVSGSALEWVDSYLRPRRCQVNIESALSDPRNLPCAVPQGSCLGPWLYLTYAGTLFGVIPPTISVYGFADDHTTNTRFRPSSPDHELKAIRELESCAVVINNWMNANKLKMNTAKTEFIMFGSKKQLDKCTSKSFNINGDEIQSENCIRYLGAFLDDKLNFKQHVKNKWRVAMMNYFRIKCDRKYLTQQAMEILVLSLVISHLDYCNVILYGISQSDLCKMQRIQNMCAKLVLKRGKFESSKENLYDLHWLPIKARISFKMLTYMYNCHVGHAPVYLTELLTKQIPNQRLRSSSTSEGCYVVPFNKRKTFSDRSFGTVGPNLWNAISCPFVSQNQ
ncbi:hypothetical protein FSP39_012065 [Pinctada imbricata]|uniref:SWIM-type domain-containing protein n=1 Tax=Pinctada imbricata TaxID=66713 RepID=A0AA88XSN8_PINIB|nr:hypothetical protein FSP39_012065 [Pinctada imbricata]